MSRSYCDDCGEPVYNGACTNCHEVLYIEEQYHDLDMDVPESLSKECGQARKDIERKAGIKATF